MLRIKNIYVCTLYILNVVIQLLETLYIFFKYNECSMIKESLGIICIDI